MPPQKPEKTLAENIAKELEIQSFSYHDSRRIRLILDESASSTYSYEDLLRRALSVIKYFHDKNFSAALFRGKPTKYIIAARFALSDLENTPENIQNFVNKTLEI